MNVFSGVKENIINFASESRVIFYEDFLRSDFSFAKLNNLKQSVNSQTITKKQATIINDNFAERYIEYVNKRENKDIYNLIIRYNNIIGAYDAG